MSVVLPTMLINAAFPTGARERPRAIGVSGSTDSSEKANSSGGGELSVSPELVYFAAESRAQNLRENNPPEPRPWESFSA